MEKCSVDIMCHCGLSLWLLRKKSDCWFAAAQMTGGTDGARLSYMGLPCPNLCTGGANEYACVQDMEKTTQLLVRLAQIYREGKPGEGK